VKAAGPRARLGQDAPDHPLGRDQIGKLELDVHQLFTRRGSSRVRTGGGDTCAAAPHPGESRSLILPKAGVLPFLVLIDAVQAEELIELVGQNDPSPASSGFHVGFDQAATVTGRAPTCVARTVVRASRHTNVCCCKPSPGRRAQIGPR